MIAEPIRDKKTINLISEYLKDKNERDYVIWTLGLNSGLRISDILNLNVSDVKDKTHITITEKKTQKRKSFLINDKLKKVLSSYIKGKDSQAPLFCGTRGNRFDKRSVQRFLDKAVKDLNLKDTHISTHSMRKSFGYHHYQKFKDAVILQKIFNHSSLHITLIYIGVEQDEIDKSYKNFEL